MNTNSEKPVERIVDVAYAGDPLAFADRILELGSQGFAPVSSEGDHLQMRFISLGGGTVNVKNMRDRLVMSASRLNGLVAQGLAKVAGGG